MFTKNTKSFATRLGLVVVLLGGMFGVSPTKSVLASNLTVMNTNDSGAGSLRQTIADAVSGETISFDESLSGQVITLASPLSIGKDLTVDGSNLSSNIKLDGSYGLSFLMGIGDNFVTIKNLDFLNSSDQGINSSGRLQVVGCSFSGNNTGIFNNSQGPLLTVTNSTFSENGIGIINFEILQVTGSVFTNNGLGIYNEKVDYLSAIGDVTISNSTFTGNHSRGGILNQNGTLTVTNSNFTNNESVSEGGGIYNGGTATVSNSQFINNTTTQDGGGISGGGSYDYRNRIFWQHCRQ